MSEAFSDSGRKAAPAKPVRPRDAGSLVIVDAAEGLPRVLFGRRRPDLKFAPGKYVFPGGRVDVSDVRLRTAEELPSSEIDKLLVDMKGRPSPARARALALAAIRETFEETGLVIGARTDELRPTRAPGWQAFYATGYAPALSQLVMMARAITPKASPRRFDARFFMVSAEAISHRVEERDHEFGDLVWATFEEARALELHSMTRAIVDDLQDLLAVEPARRMATPVPYYYDYQRTFISPAPAS
ncbi:MAG: NUDIX domain-containing protein [Hyphomicrobiaceae bacterium]